MITRRMATGRCQAKFQNCQGNKANCQEKMPRRGERARNISRSLGTLVEWELDVAKPDCQIANLNCPAKQARNILWPSQMVAIRASLITGMAMQLAKPNCQLGKIYVMPFSGLLTGRCPLLKIFSKSANESSFKSSANAKDSDSEWIIQQEILYGLFRSLVGWQLNEPNCMG